MSKVLDEGGRRRQPEGFRGEASQPCRNRMPYVQSIIFNKMKKHARIWVTLVCLFACSLVGAREGAGANTSRLDTPSYGYTALAVGLGTPASLPWGNDWDVFGLQLNLMYGECRILRGVQVAGIANVAVREMRGVQAAFLFDYTPHDAWGWQFAAGGTYANRVFGLQSALGVNFTGELHGAQIGIVNYAETCPGGFQIGLANIIMDNQFPLIPFFNCYF